MSGFNAVGTSIRQAVFRAVYTDLNARLQSAARRASPGGLPVMRMGAYEIDGDGVLIHHRDDRLRFHSLADAPYGNVEVGFVQLDADELAAEL